MRTIFWEIVFAVKAIVVITNSPVANIVRFADTVISLSVNRIMLVTKRTIKGLNQLTFGKHFHFLRANRVIVVSGVKYMKPIRLDVMSPANIIPTSPLKLKI